MCYPYPILYRYTTNSCASLEPQYAQENYASLSLGPDHLAQHSGGQEDSNFFGAPKKLSNRQPPFEIETDFVEYRRNKKYTGTEKELEHFLLSFKMSFTLIPL
jgi:hypothetical protein